MSKANNVGDFCTDIADAIRTVKGSTATINAQNFSNEIKASSTIVTAIAKLVDGTTIGGSELSSDEDYNSLTTIGDYAFRGCTSLSSITIPEGVTTIEYYAFRGCASLASITIPASVTTIKSSSFYGCTSLKTITINATTPPTLSSGVFTNCTSLTTINVPSASLSAYQSATNWSAYSSLMVGV